MNLFIKQDAQPHIAQGLKYVLMNMEQKVKDQIDEDVRMGVIRKVKSIKKDSWVARMIVMRKKNGNPRRVIDYRMLNKASSRQFKPSKSLKRNDIC